MINANIPPGFVPHDINIESSDTITTVAWSPDGQVLATGSSGHKIHFWDQQTEQHLQTLIDYSHNIRPSRLTEDRELVEDTAYVVTGPIENLYPALVVLLGYSPSFQRTKKLLQPAS